MKRSHFFILVCVSLATPLAAQNGSFTNFIRQVQTPTSLQHDVSVASAGNQLSELMIEPGGARFELWTVKADPLTSYLLDTRYVSTYTPVGDIQIVTEDPYPLIPRTRADRPFSVHLVVDGLRNGETDPEPSKAVTLLRHVQSYGPDGTGEDIDRSQALLQSQVQYTQNGEATLEYAITSVPAANLSKVRGEERFSFYTLADYQAPASQIASKFIQIWPVAEGTMSGITQGEYYRMRLPQITVELIDLYPDSRTYVQAYTGDPVLGKTGAVIPGSSLVLSESTPQDRTLILKNYESVFDSDGRWTMELLTVTPFGIDRLAHVTFDVNRSLQMNASFNTIE
jgi:hypothetical protein